MNNVYIDLKAYTLILWTKCIHALLGKEWQVKVMSKHLEFTVGRLEQT